MRKLYTLLTMCSLLLSGCINSGEKANINDLQLMSGISNRQLLLDGAEGSINTFSFRAKHDWQIIDYQGFTCDPSSGTKCDEKESITITTTTLQANNGADTVRLSDLNFKLLSTRFVGVSAYQLPQVIVKDSSLSIDAIEGSKGSARIVSKAEDIQLTTTGDITATLGTKNYRDEYTITIKATTSNNTIENRHIGTVGFVVNGVTQGGKIEVYQVPAIVFDRNLVMLPGEANRRNMFEAKAVFELDFVASSTSFTVVKSDATHFEVISTNRNDSGATLELGEIEVFLKESPDCRSTIKVFQRKPLAPQTIIVQYIGTALNPYFSNNTEKMLEALSKNIQGDAQVMVISTESTTDGALYELRYDTNLGKAIKEKVADIDLPTPYNAELFASNLRRALEFAPAEKYAMVIGSHGLAWVPKEGGSSQASRLRKLGIDPSQMWQRNPSAQITRHLGDNGTTVRYDVSEVAQAIAANNITLEYILFDACFMGNIESVYELRNVTKYIVASPCEVMGYGFPYNKVIPLMLQNGGTSYDLEAICSTYVDHYRTEASTPSACVALTHTAELEALAATVKRVNEAAVKSDFSLRNVQYYEGQSVHSFYDLGDIIEQSCADSEAVAAFNAQFDKTVTSRHHTDQFYSAYGGSNKYYHDINKYSGITTSAFVDHYSDLWQQTAWYKATH